jgi:hypothetical protein
MRPRLLYIELKSGYNDNGPAWIGKGYFSKTGQTIYFNGKAFRGGRIGGLHSEILTGDSYWISGVKKDTTDRHWAGSGKITVDKSVLSEYLALISLDELPKSKYQIVELDNSIPKELVNRIENQKDFG